jgi:outer membrane protein assembly factor BamD (BamD/ComL family)
MNHSIHHFRLNLFFGVLLGLAGLVLTTQAVQAADKKGPEISRVIAKEMTAAQKALQAGQWQEALKNLDAAEQKSPLTPFDKKTIFDFKAFADIKLNKLKDAQENYEQALATGQYSAEEAAKTKRTLFRLAAGNQQYPKALEYGKAVADAGDANGDDLLVMAQIYYLQKDCKDSTIWADKAIAYAKKAGEAPKETLYQFKLQCASDAGDNAAMATVLVDLIKLTNKTNYWNTLLRIERQDERDDHNLLMIYRVMYDTNSMDKGSDYMEMAQLLGDAALPGEAQMVLDRGVAAGLFGDQAQRDRANRLLASLKTRADSDKKGLPQFETEAAKNPAGELDVKLGEVYFGSGDYQNAAAAINRGLQKGPGTIKHLDEAYVYLGRSDVQLKNTADAKKAFAGLKTIPNISPRVLRLWELYSDKIGS